MAEIKHNFAGGKMNKDVDERLVPNGQYRHAENIQVSTSEGSSVGTIQNLYGNSKVSYPIANFVTMGSTCVGAISDEKNDTFYTFFKGPSEIINPNSSGPLSLEVRDMIIATDKNGNTYPVVVDIKSNIHQCPSFPTYITASGFWQLTLDPSVFNGIYVGDVISGFKEIMSNNVISTDEFTVILKDPASHTVTLDGPAPSPMATPSTSLYFEIFTGSKLLNFPSNSNGEPITITGINIIDELLFWTDSVNEPKKINIQRCIDGTAATGQSHTIMLNKEAGITLADSILLDEKHVTVIKKSPKSPLLLQTTPQDEFAYGVTSQSTEFWVDDSIGSASGNMPSGAGTVTLNFIVDVNSPMIVDQGDIIVLNPTSSNILPPYEYVVELKLLSQNGASPVPSTSSYYVQWVCEVITMGDNAPLDEQSYNWSSKVNFEYNYKNKFPRFSYRYKYEDGEYSSFAPFTNVAFEPGNFRYDVKEAFNKGMENTIKKLTLKKYKNNIPKDVNQIDLLYKESDSPVIYMIESLDLENHWDDEIGYLVNPTSIRATIPENQMLRPWDIVPKKALAQEVSGNRLIYGNYFQNYSLKNPYLFAKNESRTDCDLKPGFKSLKSIRSYSLGISYLDKYGRETPVFSHEDSNFEIPIDKSDSLNQIYAKANPTNAIKWWAKYYKIYVKETSNEYYNLAQDRVYDAKDGNIWLSFPSSERNKVDEETYLILKKGVAENDDVNDSNRYKILAIENEAPEYVKTIIQYSAKSDTIPTNTFVAGGLPLPTYQKIFINKASWSGDDMPLSDLLGQAPDFATLAVRFETLVAGTIAQRTKLYDVIDFHDTDPDNTGSGQYELKLDKVIDETYLEEDLSGVATPGIMNPSLKIIVYKKIITNRPEFDGRFFVKIANDITLQQHVTSQSVSDLTQVQVTGQSMPFYYVSDNDHPDITNGTSGFDKTNSQNDWETVLKFGTNSRKNYWFVDQTWYTGKYTGAELQQNGTYRHNPGSATASPASSKENGWNNGIYTDSSGQAWIHLSYGNLKNADEPGWSGSLAPSWNQATTAQKDARYQDMYNFVRSNAGSYFDIGCTTGTAPCSQKKHWQVGSTYNTNHVGDMWFVQKLVQGTQFKFGGDPNATFYTITADPTIVYHTNYRDIQHPQDVETSTINGQINYGSGYWQGYAANDAEDYFNSIHHLGHPRNRRVTYKIPIDADPTQAAFNPLNAVNGANLTTAGAIQFLEDSWVASPDQLLTEYPAIWETEPKKDIDLDIYYEMDGAFPLEIQSDTNEVFAPIGSILTQDSPSTYTGNPNGYYFIDPALEVKVIGWEDNVVELSEELNDMFTPQQSSLLTFHRPNGSCVFARFDGLHDATEIQGVAFSNKIRLQRDVSSLPVLLSYFNCYSFGNGVESNRIRDDFNQVTIEKGVKASTTIEEEYKEEHRKNSLIYSGVYNSTSGVNNLNQFIASEKITKEINPTYGSIQKLHTRDSDLVALCEDKVLKILANKDAVFNADGNPQLVSSNNVLGQVVPFSGEYGISTNPESFASENYRSYFSDKTRGAILRLSMDGLTPISEHGMKDWFRDNLKLSTKIIGSYDDYKSEYNLTLYKPSLVPANMQVIGVSYDDNKTLTFKEDVKGWVSFKSFIPDYGISCANNYYTFKSNRIWLHNDENVDANTFYLIPYDSRFTAVFNESPGSVKSFKSINYEGTQARVLPFTTDVATGLTDGEYYNLTQKDGWYVESIKTNKESGTVLEFIEKEGKWFNYIKGEDVIHNNYNLEINADGSSTFDQASFAIQGLGILQEGPVGMNIYGCTDDTMWNYDSAATVDDGSCIPFIYGCMEPNADNYGGNTTNTDDGTCVWSGCLDDPCLAINSGWSGWSNVGFPAEANAYNAANGGGSILSDGSCVPAVYGCTITDPAIVTNPMPTANVNQVSCSDTSDPCVYVVIGCTLSSADNYNPNANSESGTCTWYGCTDTPSPTYGQTSWSGVGFPANASSYVPIDPSFYGIQDDGSCIGDGCMDPTANNYDLTAVYDTLNPNYPDYSTTTGSCIYCDWSATGTNAYTGIPITTAFVNATPNSAGTGNNQNGQIAVVFDLFAPYQPFIYTLTDSSGNSAYTYSNNSYLNGVSQVDSILYSNLPPGTYTVTITGTDPATTSYCNYSVNTTIGVSAAPLFGCTDSTACNFDFPAAPLTHIDDGSCEFTTCAGCMHPLANYPNPAWTGGTSYGSQTGSSPFTNTPQCITPGTANPGPCTIACGDGNSGAGLGNWCCGYQVYGCTDANAVNFYGSVPGNTNLVDDGSCDYNGCTDPTATNYDPAATIDDGSCVYAPISGCTDSNSCNYDPAATMDDGSCLLGFVGVTIGDPDAVDNAGNAIPIPHYYYQAFPNVNTDTAQHFILGGFPVNNTNELDIGLSIKSEDPTLAQYNASSGNKVVFQVREEDSTQSNFNTVIVGPQVINNFSSPVWQHLASGAVYGSRNPAYVNPYPFGPAQNASNNYEFEVYHSPFNILKKYKIEVWSEINGVEYGKHDGPTPNCGVYQEFTFNPLNLCSHPSAIDGCTDPTACNYDPGATCDDGSCYYGTTGGYDCVNSGPPSFNNFCQPVSCGTPQFPNLNACLTGGCGSV